MRKLIFLFHIYLLSSSIYAQVSFEKSPSTIPNYSPSELKTLICKKWYVQKNTYDYQFSKEEKTKIDAMRKDSYIEFDINFNFIENAGGKTKMGKWEFQNSDISYIFITPKEGGATQAFYRIIKVDDSTLVLLEGTKSEWTFSAKKE